MAVWESLPDVPNQFFLDSDFPLSIQFKFNRWYMHAPLFAGEDMQLSAKDSEAAKTEAIAKVLSRLAGMKLALDKSLGKV